MSRLFEGAKNLAEKDLRIILDKALWSPSGDNCQPWTFEWDGEVLKVFHHSDRANHPLNPQGVASVIALGCLLESIDVASSEMGYACVANIGKLDRAEIAEWAQLRFESRPGEANPLSDALLKRCTDRRPFKGGDLVASLFQKTEESSARLHLVSKPSVELIEYVVEAEQLLVEHAEILPATLRWVRFSLGHARRTRDGFSWRNMGAKIWEVPMMPLLRDHKKILPWMKGFAGPQHRARVQKQLRSSAGVVCVSAPDAIQNRANLIHSGRLMMNAWLSLNRHDFGVQPLTIASLTGLCARQGVMELPEKWIRFFRDGEALLRKSFSISPEHSPIWMVRTGISTPLPENARTFRKALSEVLRIKLSSN